VTLQKLFSIVAFMTLTFQKVA